MKKINISKIYKYVEDGYISRKYNKDRTLSILNYTNKCTYDSLWDDVTKMCRGLIVKEDGIVIAKCFPKFFNLFEKEESMPHNLPKESFEVFTKEDGSLGILYMENKEFKISTRGSFNSDQAIWATNFLKRKLINGFNVFSKNSP